MGWPRYVGSLNVQVSFAKELYCSKSPIEMGGALVSDQGRGGRGVFGTIQVFL